MRFFVEKGLEYMEILAPSNFHVHWRELDQLRFTVLWSAKQFYYALGMLNTKVPLSKPALASSYCDKAQFIGRKINPHFKAFVALYLTDNTKIKDIDVVASSNNILSCKLYPANTTTNSSMGVTDLQKLWPIFARMEELNVPLDVHGEFIGKMISLYDRERVFIDKVLAKIHKAFPRLRIALEHVSTKEGVQFVQDTSDVIVATVAPQYLLCNCNDVYLYPSRNCYPVINSPKDQQVIADFVLRNTKKVIIGTDGAPHPDEVKFCDSGNGGCCTEPNAVPLYIKALSEIGALNMLENIASINGPIFYKLPLPSHYVRYVKKPYYIDRSIPIGHEVYTTPFFAGEKIKWQMTRKVSKNNLFKKRTKKC